VDLTMMNACVNLGRSVPALLLAAVLATAWPVLAEPVAEVPDASDTPSRSATALTDRGGSRLSRLLKEASLSSGVVDVAKLGDVGAGESVMLAFVNNSETAYKLRAEDIVYLKEHAVPDAIVTAMIERGAILRDRQPAPPPVPTVQNIVYAAPPPAPTVTFIPAPVTPEPVSTVTIIGRSDIRRGLSQWNHPYHVARPGMWRNNSSYSYSYWGGGYGSHSPYTRPNYKHGSTRIACW
jgi:hypothetical protein